ncbi:MAG: hypothetical protein AB7N91_12080 [Candidatus Tectimicrobiota bacterium]
MRRETRGKRLRARLRRALGSAALLLVFLAATLLPRFGLVWHKHDDAEHDHDHPASELAKLLSMFHEEHAHRHVSPHPSHEHDGVAQEQLLDADLLRLHGHYIADALLVFGSCGVWPVLLVLQLVLRLVVHCLVLWPHDIALVARAPPLRSGWTLIAGDFMKSRP